MTTTGGWRRWVFWLYLVFLMILTHLPPAQIERIPLKLWDKPEHLMAYSVLSLLAFWSRRGWPVGRSVRAIALSMAALMMTGAIDEWTQPIFGRACELNDWLADSLGVLLGAGIIVLIRVRAVRGAVRNAAGTQA